MNTKCLKCDYDVVKYYQQFGIDGPCLLGGYCPNCYPAGVFSMFPGAKWIELTEPIHVNENEHAHDAIVRAINNGTAKVVY